MLLIDIIQEIVKMKEELENLKLIKITEPIMSVELSELLKPKNIVLRTITLERLQIGKKCDNCYREAIYFVKESDNYFCWNHCLD